MSSIHTLNDLLIPSGQDTRCFFLNVVEEHSIAATSTFSLSLWDPQRLPPSAHLCDDLAGKMLEDLAAILDRSYSSQAGRANFTNILHRNTTPNDILSSLQLQCAARKFPFHYEGGAKAISDSLSLAVFSIFHALTGKELTYQVELPTSSGQVISDFSYKVDGLLHILGQAKSPKAFDHFIGELMQQMRGESPASTPLCTESAPTTYRGYKAMLAKVRVVASVSHLLSESSHLYI